MSDQRSSIGAAEAKLERFRSRSFNNTVLIWTQHAVAFGQGRVPEPTPTYIAGFKQRRAPGRCVDRGQVRGHGYSLRIVEGDRDLGGANGMTDYVTRSVAVRGDMDPAARAKTLAHELAHLEMHGPGNRAATLHRGISEVEAESVALIVGAAHGLLPSSHTSHGVGQPPDTGQTAGRRSSGQSETSPRVL
ncbi:ImmA/IrrE family metallo-endopeptidase [Microbacterium sp. Sa4CUA7]|uniref:ImmA/IrrE family metallo-endopeptidase n=1 Tax=Microbacterium pullorum TaxID=2762236 RepID=A0ABR8S587_9MICO|nr:ImmA/IrrE family metallo-endopeptidase [Microbacterium pullorum]MBD7958631.1 ImmA/IrrE family metallo-endopeptidase [Microbacterium pullorum]